MSDIWQTLQDYDGEMVLSGHDHGYERFLPMNSDGTGGGSDTIPSWVVGSGGKSLYPIAHSRPNSAGYSLSFGVLKIDFFHRPGEDINGATIQLVETLVIAEEVSATNF